MPVASQPLEVGSFFSVADLLDVARESRGASVSEAISARFTHVRWTGSGRVAVRMAAEELAAGRVRKLLFPAYLCASILQGVKAIRAGMGLEIGFYPVRDELGIDPGDLPTMADGRTAVYVIDYFGRPADDVAVALLDAGYPVVLDVSHSLCSARLRGLDDRVTLVVGSLRKLFPLPDGGFVAGRSAPRAAVSGEPPVAPVLSAMILKAAHAGGLAVPKRLFNELYQSFETSLDRGTEVTGPSPLSEAMLDVLGVDAGLERRRQNYDVLEFGLRGLNRVRPLFLRGLAGDLVPLGFPVLCEDRDGLRRWLVSCGIYPPVHWPVPDGVRGKVSRTARAIARRELTIPCDWRYTPEVMERVVEAVRAWDRPEPERSTRRCPDGPEGQ